MSSRRLAVIAFIGAICVCAGCGSLDDQLLGKYRNLPVWDYFTDRSIASEVKTQLAADPGVDSTRIEITSADRIVHLNGVVDSVEQKTRAQEAAFKAAGVRGVANNLQVVSPP
jgi:osmotically-inducible protein OsmY